LVNPVALLRSCVDLVVPPRCPSCGEIVDADDRFCQACWSNFEFILPPVCSVCGVPFDYEVGDGARCATCILDPPHYTSARAALVYGDVARKLALSLKHSDKPHLATAMASHMLRVGHDLLDPERGLLVAVPLHRWRLWSRGYNQALLLARSIARASGVPLSIDALVRVKATQKSGSLGPAERRRNVRNAIGLGPGAGRWIENRRIILVDDVLTTGATANACADVLFRAGAESVHVLAFSRVARDRADAHI
jgi:ComF family protein